MATRTNDTAQSNALLPTGGALLFVEVQCGPVHFYCSVVYRNKRANPTYFSTLLRWVTKPSERVRKRGATHSVILNSFKKYPVRYDQGLVSR